MATHIVVKTISTAGGDLLPGAQVDASAWRNTAALVRARYLRPITDADRTTDTPAPVAPRRQRGREVAHAE